MRRQQHTLEDLVKERWVHCRAADCMPRCANAGDRRQAVSAHSQVLVKTPSFARMADSPPESRAGRGLNTPAQLFQACLQHMPHLRLSLLSRLHVTAFAHLVCNCSADATDAPHACVPCCPLPARVSDLIIGFALRGENSVERCRHSCCVVEGAHRGQAANSGPPRLPRPIMLNDFQECSSGRLVAKTRLSQRAGSSHSHAIVSVLQSTHQS